MLLQLLVVGKIFGWFLTNVAMFDLIIIFVLLNFALIGIKNGAIKRS